MLLYAYPYIKFPVFTGSLETDAQNLLICNGHPKTSAHIWNVAKANEEIAEQYGLSSNKCRIAGLLHDISAVIRPQDMLQYAKDNRFTLCEAEKRYPFLLHQRISRIIAVEYFGIGDEDILSPIEHHTTCKEKATPYDMALFLADKLAWDQEGSPPFYEAVKKALNVSLEKAAMVYMNDRIEHDKLLCPHRNWTLAYRWLEKQLGQNALFLG